MALPTRKPTGQPGWDLMLIAGAPKCGKSFTAAEAACSDRIGRALWWSFGEADPEEYGAMPGSKIEFVNYEDYDSTKQRTYQGLMASLRDALKEERVDGNPTLWVIDSAGRIWGHLSDQAQYAARLRQARKEQNRRDAVVGEKGDVGEEAQIHSDLWNSATDRWYDLIELLKQHNGPVILTGLLKESTIFSDAGQPTKHKEWKIEAQKNFAADVGVVVEIPRLKEHYVTGVRSLRFEPVSTGEHTKDTRFRDFSVEKLWDALGWLEHDAKVSHGTVRRENSDPDGILRGAIKEAVNKALQTPLNERVDHLRAVFMEFGQESMDNARVQAPDGSLISGTQLIDGWVKAVESELAKAQKQSEQPAQEQEARAQEPAQGQRQNPLVLLGSEIEGHAGTLGTTPGQYVKPLLAQHEGAQRIKDVPVPKVLEWVVAQRPAVAAALREKGEASAAAAVESFPPVFALWEQVATPREDAQQREPVNA